MSNDYTGDFVKSTLTIDPLSIPDATVYPEYGSSITSNKSIKKKDVELVDHVRTALTSMGMINENNIVDTYFDINKTVLSKYATSQYKTKTGSYADRIYNVGETNKEISDKNFTYPLVTFDFTEGVVDYYSFPPKEDTRSYPKIRTIMENDINEQFATKLSNYSEPFLYVNDLKLNNGSEIILETKSEFDSKIKLSQDLKLTLADFIYDDSVNAALPTATDVGNPDVIYDAVKREWIVKIKNIGRTIDEYATKPQLEIVSRIPTNKAADVIAFDLDIKRPEYLTYELPTTADRNKLNNGKQADIDSLITKYGPIYAKTFYRTDGTYKWIELELLNNVIHSTTDFNEYSVKILATQSNKETFDYPTDRKDLLFTISIIVTKDDKVSSYTFIDNKIAIYKTPINVATLFGTQTPDKVESNIDKERHTIKLKGDFTIELSVQQLFNKVQTLPNKDKAWREALYTSINPSDKVYSRNYTKAQFDAVTENDGTLDYKVLSAAEDGSTELELSQIRFSIINRVTSEIPEETVLTIPIMNIVGIREVNPGSTVSIENYIHYNAKAAFILRTIPGNTDKQFPAADKTISQNAVTFYWDKQFKDGDDKKFTHLYGYMNIKIAALNKPEEPYKDLDIIIATANNTAKFPPDSTVSNITPILPGIIEGEDYETARSNVISKSTLADYINARAEGDDNFEAGDLATIFDADDYIEEYDQLFPYDTISTDDGFKRKPEINDVPTSKGMTWYEAVIQAFSKETIRVISKYLLEGQVEVNKKAIEYLYNNVIVGDNSLLQYVNDIFEMTTDHKTFIDTNTSNIAIHEKRLDNHDIEINGVLLDTSNRKGNYSLNDKYWRNFNDKSFEDLTLVRTGNQITISGCLVSKDINIINNAPNAESAVLFTLTREIRPSKDIRIPIQIMEWVAAGNSGSVNNAVLETVNAFVLIKADTGKVGIIAHQQNTDFANPINPVLTTKNIQTTTPLIQSGLAQVDPVITRPWILFQGSTFYIG